MDMKIFVTGPYSRIGTRLVEAAQKRGMSVAGQDAIRQKTRIVDVTDENALASFLAKEKPGLVVNTAAMTDVDGCEKDPATAQKINVSGAECVAKTAKACGARLVHISTDFVFDGDNGPYSEGDRPNPINEYGKSKLLSEDAVFKFYPDALITRICVPYDWNTNARSNFLMWAIGMLKKGEKIKGLTDQWSTPSCVPHIVRAMLDLGASNEKGLVHLSDRDFLSRYDFLRIAAEVFGLDAGLITPGLSKDLNQAARRPVKGGLKVQKAETILPYPMFTVREGLALVKGLL